MTRELRVRPLQGFSRVPLSPSTPLQKTRGFCFGVQPGLLWLDWGSRGGAWVDKSPCVSVQSQVFLGLRSQAFSPSSCFSSKCHAGRMPTKLLCKEGSQLRVLKPGVFRTHAGSTFCFPRSASSSEFAQHCFCCPWQFSNQDDGCVPTIFGYCKNDKFGPDLSITLW